MRTELENQVLKKIVPTTEENQQIKYVVVDLQKKLSAVAQSLKVTVDIMLVGSIAKGTHLSDSLDIDLFILFPTNVPYRDLEKIGLEMGKAVIPQWEIQYANHPYVRGIYNRFKVDIVPCYKVSNPQNKISAVDRTPFHTKYVVDNLAAFQKDEVRLLKKFLKGINCYSAEEKVQGFSGYLAELLVIKYHTFRDTLINSQTWQPGEILALTNKKHAYFPSSLVFIDPVDPARNVASALSKEKLDLFLLASKAYLKCPKMEFFFPKKVTPWPLHKIIKKIDNFVGIQIPKPMIVDDILYSQIRKAGRSIASLCKQYDFSVEDVTFHVNNDITLFLKLKTLVLPPTKIHMGPPVHQREYVQSFKERWKNCNIALSPPFEKDSRWWIEIKREYVDLIRLLQEKISEVNLGTHLNAVVDKSEILGKSELVQDIFAEFWTSYFDKCMPWER